MEIAALVFSLATIGYACWAYKNLSKTLDPLGLAITMVYLGGGGLAVLAYLIIHWMR